MDDPRPASAPAPSAFADDHRAYVWLVEKVQWHLERTRPASDPFDVQHIRACFQRQDGHCFYCRERFVAPRPRRKFSFLNARYHIEHKQPIACGGTNDRANVVLACERCNIEKGIWSAEEYLAALARRDGAKYGYSPSAPRAPVRTPEPGTPEGLAADHGLVFLSSRKSRKGQTLWTCRCACGFHFETRRRDIVRGKVKSCGCKKRKAVIAHSRTHRRRSKGRRKRQQALLQKARGWLSKIDRYEREHGPRQTRDEFADRLKAHRDKTRGRRE